MAAGFFDYFRWVWGWRSAKLALKDSLCGELDFVPTLGGDLDFYSTLQGDLEIESELSGDLEIGCD